MNEEIFRLESLYKVHLQSQSSSVKFPLAVVVVVPVHHRQHHLTWINLNMSMGQDEGEEENLPISPWTLND